MYDPTTGDPIYVKDEKGNIVYLDGWKPPIPDEDKNVDFAKYGYKSLDELVRWRLYNRTGAGLMAELGSHQLDACSIFLGKKHPLAVTGIGGTFFYTDGREVDDHVFVTFEFPGKDYEPGTGQGDHVVVTYSSINTNSFEKYGETVMGSRGTMIVEEEKEILLYKEAGSAGRLAADEHHGREGAASKPVIEASPSTAGPSAATVARRPGDGRPLARLSRGARALRLLRPPRQRVELPRRQGPPAPLPRRGRPGRRRDRPDQQHRHAAEAADRVRRRWFDYQSPEVPDGSTARDRPPRLSRLGGRSGSVIVSPSCPGRRS